MNRCEVLSLCCRSLVGMHNFCVPSLSTSTFLKFLVKRMCRNATFSSFWFSRYNTPFTFMHATCSRNSPSCGCNHHMYVSRSCSSCTSFFEHIPVVVCSDSYSLPALISTYSLASITFMPAAHPSASCCGDTAGFFCGAAYL